MFKSCRSGCPEWSSLTPSASNIRTCLSLAANFLISQMSRGFPWAVGERWFPGALKVLNAEPANGGLLSPLQRLSSPHQPTAPCSERACVALGRVRLPGRAVWCPNATRRRLFSAGWEGRLPGPESPGASAVAWLLSWASVRVGSRLSARSGGCQDSQATGPPGPVSLTPSRLIALGFLLALTLCRFPSRRTEEPSLWAAVNDRPWRFDRERKPLCRAEGTVGESASLHPVQLHCAQRASSSGPSVRCARPCLPGQVLARPPGRDKAKDAAGTERVPASLLYLPRLKQTLTSASNAGCGVSQSDSRAVVSPELPSVGCNWDPIMA